MTATDRLTSNLLALSIALAAGRCALAQNTSELEHGKQVFDYWCAPCHAPGPRHPGTQALEALYKGQKPAALEQREDLRPPVTATFVRNGVSIMPPFRKTEISDADLAALAAYLAR
jgi:mono/diheme cytochrome c family protein